MCCLFTSEAWGSLGTVPHYLLLSGRAPMEPALYSKIAYVTLFWGGKRAENASFSPFMLVLLGSLHNIPRVNCAILVVWFAFNAKNRVEKAGVAVLTAECTIALCYTPLSAHAHCSCCSTGPCLQLSSDFCASLCCRLNWTSITILYLSDSGEIHLLQRLDSRENANQIGKKQYVIM